MIDARSKRRNAVFAIVLVGAAVLIAPRLHAELMETRKAPPIDVFVVTTGSLPGFQDSQLPHIFAEAMNAATKEWHFIPSRAGLSGRSDRIELSFHVDPNATGTVRNYGLFSRATMARLLNIHRSISIEARVFRDGRYLGRVDENAYASESVHDKYLAKPIAELTRAIITDLRDHPGRGTGDQ